MGFFNEYPYTNLHELNLDWMISKINDLSEDMKNFLITNYIEVANPIHWSIDRDYKKSTIVLDNNGNTYISLKDVPHGIYLSDSNFWEKIADYDAQVFSYFNSLLNLINNKEKNIVMLSDSYGMSDGKGGWCSKAKAILEKCGYKCDYIAASGYGFVGNDGKFIDLMNDYVENKTEKELKDVTEVVIAGGWNDIGKSNVENSIITFVNKAKELFPNALIDIAFIAFDTTYGVWQGANYIYKEYSRACNQCGANFFDNAVWSSHVINNMSDTRHPNDDGYSNIANCIVEYILKKSCDVYINRVPSEIIYSSGIIGDNNNYSFVSNGTGLMYFNSTSLQIPNSVKIQCDDNHPILIGSIKGVIVGDPIQTAGENINVVFLRSDTSTLIYGSGRMYIENGNLYFRPFFSKDIGSTEEFPVSVIYTEKFKIIQNLWIS